MFNFVQTINMKHYKKKKKGGLLVCFQADSGVVCLWYERKDLPCLPRWLIVFGNRFLTDPLSQYVQLLH